MTDALNLDTIFGLMRKIPRREVIEIHVEPLVANAIKCVVHSFSLSRKRRRKYIRQIRRSIA